MGNIGEPYKPPDNSVMALIAQFETQKGEALAEARAARKERDEYRRQALLMKLHSMQFYSGLATGLLFSLPVGLLCFWIWYFWRLSK